jgi:NAD(P)-dependent dehydrogenase (short-subunit alcohol dehydrogenase family)
MSGRFAQYPSLADRGVFITGGGSGIGASIVEHFCAQRARVAFVDIDEAASTALCTRIRDAGMNPPTFIACDLRDVAALQAIVKRVGDDSGPVTVLVNNAANDDRHKATDVTLEYWNDRIAVNLRHQFFAAQAVYPQMKAAGGGSIVNFGSISWMNSEGNFNAYTTSKAGVHGDDPRTRARLGRGPHPGEHGRARMGADAAPDRPVARREWRAATLREPVSQGEAVPTRHCANGALARRG